MSTKIIQNMKSVKIVFDDSIIKAKGDFNQKIELAFRQALGLTHQRLVVKQNYETPSIPHWSVQIQCCASCQPTFVHHTQDNEPLWDFILNELGAKPTAPFAFEVQVPLKLWA